MGGYIRAPTAIATAPAGDVERNRNDVTFLDELDIAAKLDDFAGDLVAENQPRRRGRPPADHVLVGAADVGRDDLEQNAVLDLLFARRIVQLRKIDRFNFDYARLDIGDSTIRCHDSTSAKIG